MRWKAAAVILFAAAGVALAGVVGSQGGTHNCKPAWKCSTTSGTTTEPSTTSEPGTTTTSSGCTKSLSSGDIKAFVASLAPGENGCVSGAYSVGIWKVTNSGFTLVGPATIQGVVYLQGVGTTLRNLTIDGTGIADVTLVLWANNLTVSNLDVSNGTTGYSCIIIGSGGAPKQTGVRVLASHLHDCGDDPQHDHGIYIDNASGAYIADNTIDHVAAWGIQLYPDADNTVVEHNAISYMQRSSVIFGSQGSTTSTGNIVRDNVLTFPAYWYSQTYWGGQAGSGNELAFNCVWGAGRGLSDGGSGVSVHDNIVADPSLGGCTGQGPR